MKILNLYWEGKREMFCLKKTPAVAGVRKESWKFARAGNLA